MGPIFSLYWTGPVQFWVNTKWPNKASRGAVPLFREIRAVLS